MTIPVIQCNGRLPFLIRRGCYFNLPTNLGDLKHHLSAILLACLSSQLLLVNDIRLQNHKMLAVFDKYWSTKCLEIR